MIVLTNAAGLLIVTGFGSVAYTLITKQTTVRRLPAYWLSLVMGAMLVGIYFDFVYELVRGADLLPGWSIRAAFVVVYIMLGCLLILIPFIDRAEWRDLNRATDKLEETLSHVDTDEMEALPGGEDGDS